MAVGQEKMEELIQTIEEMTVLELSHLVKALEDRFGPQPQNGLVFQVLGDEGPVWVTAEDGGEPVPLAWSKNAYNQWVQRVWNPARTAAAQAPVSSWPAAARPG